MRSAQLGLPMFLVMVSIAQAGLSSFVCPEEVFGGRVVQHHEEALGDKTIDRYDIEVLEPISGGLKAGDVISVRMPGVREVQISVGLHFKSHPLLGQRVVASIDGTHTFQSLYREFAGGMVDDHNDVVMLQAGLLKSKARLDREAEESASMVLLYPLVPSIQPTPKPVRAPYEVPDFKAIVNAMRAAPPCDPHQVVE